MVLTYALQSSRRASRGYLSALQDQTRLKRIPASQADQVADLSLIRSCHAAHHQPLSHFNQQTQVQLPHSFSPKVSFACHG